MLSLTIVGKVLESINEGRRDILLNQKRKKKVMNIGQEKHKVRREGVA